MSECWGKQKKNRVLVSNLSSAISSEIAHKHNILHNKKQGLIRADKISADTDVACYKSNGKD